MAIPGTCKHIKREYGMEVCPTCDYGTCPECGARYIMQDTGDVCYPCSRIKALRTSLEILEEEQRQRKSATHHILVSGEYRLD